MNQPEDTGARKKFVGVLSSHSMLRHLIHTDPEPTRSSETSLVELPAPDTASADGMKKAVKDLHDAHNLLVAREKSGRTVTEDEWNTLNEGLRELSGKLKATEETLRASSALLGKNDEQFLLEKAAMRLETPDDVHPTQRNYFNVVALKFEELAGLSHANAGQRQSAGIADDIARVYRSPGASRLAETQRRLQYLNDFLLVKDVVLAPGANRGPRADLTARAARMKQYAEWSEYERLVGEFSRAFNETTATAGGNWVPTVLSAQMMDLIQQELRVAALFPAITMTSKTLDWPVLGADLTAYLMGESTADGTGSEVLASTATINKVTFTAAKFGVRSFASSEVMEDSLVNVVQFILGNAAKVLARAIEDALINGQTTASFATSALDGAVFNPTTSTKRGWNGLRHWVFKGTAGTTALPSAIDMGGIAVTVPKIIDVQLNMGIFGANPSAFTWVTGFRGWKSLMKLPELITMDKVGNNAAILTGQIGVLFGSPVILSEFVFDQKTTGMYGDGTARTFGSILGVYRDAFGFASRRAIGINASSDRYIEQDATVFVGTTRNDFQPFYATSAAVCPVGILYDIV